MAASPARSIRAEVAHLERAVQRIPREARAIVQRGALEAKKQLQAEAKGVSHAPRLPQAITYTSFVHRGELGFEVGPEEGGPGSLALLYLGNRNTGARLKDPRFALERQAEETTKRLTELIMALA